MGVSIAFSAFMALSLTPALCATLLKPVEAGHHHAKGGFFGWFNRGFSRTAKGYEGVVARILPRAARYLVIYAAVDGRRRGAVPAACRPRFLPATRTRATSSSTCSCRLARPRTRTLDVMEKVEGFVLKQPEVQSMVERAGFQLLRPAARMPRWPS
jgi:multidrug efflux pump